MKGFLFSLFVLANSLGCLQAQTIAGRVFDRATNEPIAYASVYLDGTSVYTLTDAGGSFRLTSGKVINTNLIISHLSYDPVSIPNPFDPDAIADIVYLTEKKNLIGEVVVLPDKYTRAQKLKVFRDHFLGKTEGGKSCKILNEDDIDLYFNLHNNQLTASSNNPIIIENDYLGYKITYTLADFYVTAPFYPTKFGAPQQTVIKGTTSFLDLAPKSRKIKKRRDAIYEISSVAFFKGLAAGSLQESKFMLFNNRLPADPKNFFRTTDTLSIRKVSLLPGAGLSREPELKYNGEGEIKGAIDILYDRKVQSGLIFLTDSFLVDEYGNVDLTDKLLFYGSIGSQRVGDMLPLDYEIN
jgi:hypothetical protein